MIGANDAARIRRHTSTPSSVGKPRSNSTRSGSDSLTADSAAGPQAFTAGRSLGVQFHPEVTPEIMDAWVEVYRHELDQEGVDPDRLLDETYKRADDTRAAAWRLFDGFLARARNLTGAGRGR